MVKRIKFGNVSYSQSAKRHNQRQLVVCSSANYYLANDLPRDRKGIRQVALMTSPAWPISHSARLIGLTEAARNEAALTVILPQALISCGNVRVCLI